MPTLLDLLTMPLIAGAAITAMAQQSGETDVIVFADALRKVKIVYTAGEFTLKRCEVKLGKDARVIDQMMCSILANCVAAGWSGMDRATKCVNRRVDEIEQAAASGSIPKELAVPEDWLVEGQGHTITAADGEASVTGAGLRITPGEWVFTELMVGRTNKGISQPYMLSWRKCITLTSEDTGLAHLIEPLPFTTNLRMAMPLKCRQWSVKVDGGALAGNMACNNTSGASTTGTLKGRYSTAEIVLHRERRWKRSDGWAEASFDTRGVHRGNCPA